MVRLCKIYLISHFRYLDTVVTVRTTGHLSIKTKMFDLDECVLIGWLTNTLKEPANQNAFLKVKQFCFYARVVCLSYSEYNSISGSLTK